MTEPKGRGKTQLTKEEPAEKPIEETVEKQKPLRKRAVTEVEIEDPQEVVKPKKTRKAAKKEEELVEETKLLQRTRSKKGNIVPTIDQEPVVSTPVITKKTSRKVTIVTPATQAAQLVAENSSRPKQHIESTVEEEPVAKRPTRSRR